MNKINSYALVKVGVEHDCALAISTKITQLNQRAKKRGVELCFCTYNGFNQYDFKWILHLLWQKPMGMWNGRY